MKNVEKLKDILMFKESTTALQNAFMEELNEVYIESDEEERKFLENSVDHIFRKFYYSAVEPETYITPANIMSALAEKETDGGTVEDTVFFPKIMLIKQKGMISKIRSTLHYVNPEKHYMVDDLETVLEICSKGIKVNDFGIPDNSERTKFKNRLFLNDRHYHNIIILAAIRLKYIQIAKDKNKYVAITTMKAKELSSMTIEDKIKLLAEGIIESFINASISQIPELKGVLTKDTVREVIKNPPKLTNLIDTVNDKIGIDFDLIEKTIYRDEEGLEQMEQLQDLLISNPSGFQLALFMIMLDMYLFTPLGYYLQLIKPFYCDVYNFVIELGNIFNFLRYDYTHARNMLFSIPDEFDLTPLGERILLDGKKSKRQQIVPKEYNDAAFLESIKVRDQYIEEELTILMDELKQVREYDEYNDEYYFEYDDEYDFEDEEYEEENDDGQNGESNVISLFDYKKKKSDAEKKDGEG